MSHIQQEQQLREEQLQEEQHAVSPAASEEISEPTEALMRNSSASTTIVNRKNLREYHARRKSMVLQDSKNPIEDALYEMERIKSIGSGVFASSDVRVGRVRDHGITITLPIVTSQGEPVIKYAKAVYPLSDNDAPEVAHFRKGDYLLITSVVNEDWFTGEVYENDSMDRNHTTGLIPCNFIKVLS